MNLASLNDIASLWGPAMLRACWHGALAVGVVWAICRCFPRLSPATRATLWWLACLKMLLGLFFAGWLPVAVLPALPAAAPAVVRYMPAYAELSVPEQAPLSAPSVPVIPALEPTAPVSPVGGAFALWAGGVLLLLTLVYRERRMVQQLVARARPWTDSALITSLAHLFGLRRLPPVLVSDTACSSLVVGLWQPKVLLCSADLIELGPDERRALLAHELAHIRRRDIWAGLLPGIVRVLFFFHPFAWLACREYELAREAACDAESLRASGLPPADYGRLLLKLSLPASSPSLRSGLTTLGVASPHGRQLRRRLHGLRGLTDGQALSRWCSLLLLGITGGILSLNPIRARTPSLPVDVSIAAGVVSPVEAPHEDRAVALVTPTVAPALSVARSVAAPTAPLLTPKSMSTLAPTKGNKPTMKPTTKLSSALAATAALVAVSAPTTLAPLAASAQEAPIAPVAPAPILAPIVVAPVAPEAPSPRQGRTSQRYQYTLRMGESYSVNVQDSDIGSDQQKLAKAQIGDCLIVDRDGKRYLITDPATLRRARDNYAPLEALGKQMEADGKVMEDQMEARGKVIEAEMEARGKEMEAKGEEMGTLGEKIGDASEAERKTLLKQMDALKTQLENLGKEMRTMGEKMRAEGEKVRDSGNRVRETGKKMRAAAKKADERMVRLLDDAFKSKLAVEQAASTPEVQNETVAPH